MAIDGYQGKDCPIAFGGSFITRAQTFEFNRNKPTEERYELGNAQPTGVLQRAFEYTGRLVWNPIGVQVENFFAGLTESGSLVSWKQMCELAVGMPLVSPKGGLQEAICTGLEYSVRVGGDFQATATIMGNGWHSGSAYTATAPSGVPAYEAKDVHVTVNEVPSARAQGVTARVNVRPDRLYELGDADPIRTARDRISASCEIDWVESDSLAGLVTALTNEAPGDIVIDVDSKILIEMKDMVWESEGGRDNVNGFATRRATYRSKTDAAYWGLHIIKNP